MSDKPVHSSPNRGPDDVDSAAQSGGSQVNQHREALMTVRVSSGGIDCAEYKDSLTEVSPVTSNAVLAVCSVTEPGLTATQPRCYDRQVPVKRSPAPV
ncbi:hypothetical protein J6590_014576 [Homalodisca vitripennis]|nr:hypothetical protein J6590_014576 [Homalodisca vitripennis]